jgi:hypothetical protein
VALRQGARQIIRDVGELIRISDEDPRQP